MFIKCQVFQKKKTIYCNSLKKPRWICKHNLGIFVLPKISYTFYITKARVVNQSVDFWIYFGDSLFWFQIVLDLHYATGHFECFAEFDCLIFLCILHFLWLKAHSKHLADRSQRLITSPMMFGCKTNVLKNFIHRRDNVVCPWSISFSTTFKKLCGIWGNNFASDQNISIRQSYNSRAMITIVKSKLDAVVGR